MCIATVTNIVVALITDALIQVSWDSVMLPELTGYIVYYSQIDPTRTVTTERSVNVSSSDTSARIENLIGNVQYQFEVVAVAELYGDVVTGQRSPTLSVSVVLPEPITHTGLESKLFT